MSKSNQEYKVRDCAIDDEYDTIDSDATIEEAAKKMKKIGFPDLVVIEKGTSKVLGVVADFDIVQNIVAEGKDPKTEKVTAAMYSIEPVTLDALVSDAFIKMQELNVNIVPIVKGEKLVGVCSIQDAWSYIPDQNVDDVGFIAVSDPNNAELWFSSVCSLVAYILGILLPLVGIFGFFIADSANISALLGTARSGSVTFYLFEAQGSDSLYTFINLISRSPIWALIVVCSFAVLIIGTLGMFSIIYTRFSDVRNIKTGQVVRIIIPTLVIALMILEWILLLVAFGLVGILANVTVDAIGLIMSILSMVLFFAAINSEYIFRQEKASGAEVSS